MIEFVDENKFFPVIHFETGDLAGFKVNNGICEDEVILYNHEEKTISDISMDFYGALVKYGFKSLMSES